MNKDVQNSLDINVPTDSSFIPKKFCSGLGFNVLKWPYINKDRKFDVLRSFKTFIIFNFGHFRVLTVGFFQLCYRHLIFSERDLTCDYHSYGTDGNGKLFIYAPGVTFEVRINNFTVKLVKLNVYLCVICFSSSRKDKM